VKILGVDPGLQRTGFAVLEHKPRDVKGAGDFLVIHSGYIQTSLEEGQDFAHRLVKITSSLQNLVETHQPDVAAVEIVFMNVNPKSTLLLGQARGAALVGLALAGLPVFEYTALQVKKSVVGYGKAAKQQVQMMVQQLLKLPALPQADTADAMACAICHAHSLSDIPHHGLASGAEQLWRNSVSRRVRKGRHLRLASLDDLPSAKNSS
jgi:crossover junction endodeoxyribonuclease RuvC